MPTLSLKYLEQVTDKLKEENSDLRNEVDSLRRVVGSLRNELQALQIVVSENIERREAVETGLIAVEQACSDLNDSHKILSSAVELQAQYSRKSTLLLSGRAIPAYKEGENTRVEVVTLLKEFLGMNIHLRAITACHRLRNKAIILVRFADMDERSAVYRQRLSPIKKGLIIHESLTTERLAVIKTLQRLHTSKESSPFQSYYTSMGKIFIRLANVPKAIELFVGTTEKDILDICRKQTAKNSSLTDTTQASTSTHKAPLASNSRDESQHDVRVRGNTHAQKPSKPNNQPRRDQPLTTNAGNQGHPPKAGAGSTRAHSPGSRATAGDHSGASSSNSATGSPPLGADNNSPSGSAGSPSAQASGPLQPHPNNDSAGGANGAEASPEASSEDSQKKE